jgi:hypothetical protein
MTYQSDDEFLEIDAWWQSDLPSLDWDALEHWNAVLTAHLNKLVCDTDIDYLAITREVS